MTVILSKELLAKLEADLTECRSENAIWTARAIQRKKQLDIALAFVTELASWEGSTALVIEAKKTLDRMNHVKPNVAYNLLQKKE